MVTTTYRVSDQVLEMVPVIFAGRRVVMHPYPPFLADKEVLVVGEKEPPPYKDKAVILLSKRSGLRLDQREGQVEFLVSKGVHVSEEVAKHLKELEDEVFFDLFKTACVLKKVPKFETLESSSVFQVFKTMFTDFSEVYKQSKKEGFNHRQVFSALMTMMLKTGVADSPELSAGYRKVLLANKPYMVTWKRKVLEYLETRMTLMDFLSFMASLSEDKRGTK